MNAGQHPHLFSPPLRIAVDEELTVCTHCGTRTEYYGERTDDGEAVEFCPNCGQNYIVEEHVDA